MLRVRDSVFGGRILNVSRRNHLELLSQGRTTASGPASVLQPAAATAAMTRAASGRTSSIRRLATASAVLVAVGSEANGFAVEVCNQSVSLSAAAAAVRHYLRHAGPAGADPVVEVQLCAGRHAVAEPLVLGPEDSGNDRAPVVWRSTGGPAVLDAGLHISGWHESPSDRGLWEAPLPQNAQSRQLWVNGQRATRARSKGILISGDIERDGYGNASCVDENAPADCDGWGTTHSWSCPGSHIGYWHGVPSWVACKNKCCALANCTAAMYFAGIHQDCYALARPVSAKSCSLTTAAQTATRSRNSTPTPPQKSACPEAPLSEWLTPGAEFVYRPAGATWTEPRCPVAAVHETVSSGNSSAGQLKITMGSPCFTVARGKFQVCLSVYLSVCLSVRPSVCLSVRLSV